VNEPIPQYASRAGAKLHAALHAFQLDPADKTFADLGCSTGGFTDCLLQHHAARVYAVDTAYGELAWKLRQDPRVTTLERTNALHYDPWQQREHFTGVDAVTLDLGWTPQTKAIPAALQWLTRTNDRPAGVIITLIKPHYEARQHHLTDDHAESISRSVLDTLASDRLTPAGLIPSPVRGGKGKNLEFLARLDAH
jgi:23S rRNA (cytidine1920-2'-O)/16S rRNA (cytidine1409-2'-O)-methyltransferase